MLHKNLSVLLTTILPRRNGFFYKVTTRSMPKYVLHPNHQQTANYTTVVEEEIEVMKEVKNIPNNSSALQTYLEQHAPTMLSIGPKKKIKITSVGCNSMYLVNPETAKEFVSLIIEDLMENPSFVAELNPGLGFLTEELLNAGVPFVHMYEESMNFQQTLGQLISKYPGRLSLKEANLFQIAKIMYIDNVTNRKKVQELLDGIQRNPWEGDTSMQIIGAVTTPIFMRHLLMSLLFQNGFMEYGRPVFFLAIPPSIWMMFTGVDKRQNTKNIIFETLFNYKLLGTVSRKSFIPWQKKIKVFKKHASRIWQTEDHQIMNVVKIEPKPDLYTKYLKKEDLVYFWHFVRHNAITSTKRVIPELEKIVPNCGVRLIAKDFNIFTEFGDLSPAQILELYNEFRSWPEFDKCGFLPAVNSIISKMDENLILDLGTYYEDFN